MVIRPTVEQWNRGQLEDEYHKLYRQNVEIKKKNNELEKSVKQLNGRLRRSTGDGQHTGANNAQNEEIQELQRENDLLSQKLKALKHQLLVYTRPGVRAPMINSLTSRASARPSVRQAPASVRHGSAQNSSRKSPTEPMAPREKSQSPGKLKIGLKKQEDDSKAAKPKTLAEKALVIKLNRELKARMSEITELTFQVSSAQEKFQSLREEYDSCIAELEIARHQLSLYGESARSGHEGEVRAGGDASLLEKELTMVRDENRLLRETNDRLVASVLEGDGLRVGNEDEVKTLQMRIHEMETQLADAETERKDLSLQNRDLEKEKQRLTKKITKLRQQIEAVQSQRMTVGQNLSTDQAGELTDREPSPLPLKKRNLNDVMGPLEKLFEDVTLMLETRTTSDTFSEDKSEFSSTRYQKMYQELYEELEKVRNMLLIQHKINQQQTEEILLLNSTSEGYKQEYERKLAYFLKELKKRKQRIVFLEDQLKSIAYGKDLRRVESDSIVDVSLAEDRPNEIELHFSKLTVNSEDSYVFSSLRPQLFLSTEFFDFELQTTEVFVGPEVILGYTTLYDVIVSNLFLHYVETDGITVELYEARYNTYHLCGSGVINLKNLISLKPEKMLNTELSLISADNKQREVGKLSYSLSVKEELLKALKAHKKQSIARSLTLEQDTVALGESNELIVSVHRCSNLHLLTKDKKPPTTFITYELFDFEPVTSKSIPSSSHPEYSAVNTFKVPLSNAVHNYLKSVELMISVIADADHNRLMSASPKKQAIGRVSVPLFLLARNKSIMGTFSLTDSNGSISKATVDIAIRWRFDYKFSNDAGLPDIPPVSPSSSEMSERAIKELERELEEEKKKVHITIESDSSTSDFDEKLSPADTNHKRIKQISIQSAESEESSSSTVISTALARKESTPQNMSSFTDDEDFMSHSRPPVRLVEPTEDVSDGPLSPEHSEEELEVISAKTSEKSEQQPESERGQPAIDVGESENDLTENIESIPDEDASVSVTAPPRSHIGNLPPLTNARPIAPPRLRRVVEFTDPLHRSIPPSENSSFSESEEPRRRRLTNPNPPTSQPPSGVLKPTEHADDTTEEEENVEAVVAVRIARLSLVERSLLSSQEYNGLNVFIEWKFLDFPQEECETPNSLPLPRNRSASSDFKFSKEYGLNKRRISLLRQWIELLNRLEFTLVTDGGDEGECDDLGVAQLDLREVAAQNVHRIEFLNIDGIPIAEIEVEIIYSKILLEYFNV